jgi:glutathione synthase/RimK-type ligase-like ATP-grasp enzyme
MKYYVIGTPFPDWKIHFQANSNITYIDSLDLINHKEKYIIIPICPNDYIRYNPNKLIFYTKFTDIIKLNNKGYFAEFMKIFFPDYIPLTIYYKVNDIIYKSNITKPTMIIKPTIGCAGINTKIIDSDSYLQNINLYHSADNIVISEYIEHDNIYAGHFLIINGILIDKIYFYLENIKNKIYCGRLRNYKVSDKLPCNDDIFLLILNKINYSGFACIDFTIKAGKIYIFEINPRMGGSLVFNLIYFNRFFVKLKNYYSKKIL